MNLLRKLTILPFCGKTSYQFAKKSELKQSGKMLPDLDLLIASIFLQTKAVPVTNHTRHFDRVEGLRIEHWLRE